MCFPVCSDEVRPPSLAKAQMEESHLQNPSFDRGIKTLWRKEDARTDLTSSCDVWS